MTNRIKTIHKRDIRTELKYRFILCALAPTMLCSVGALQTHHFNKDAVVKHFTVFNAE